MTQAAHTEQSDVVYDVALKLEQTQHVLSELFHELSQAATGRHSAEHRGICFIIGSTKRLLRSTELRFSVLSSHHCVACPWMDVAASTSDLHLEGLLMENTSA